MTEGAGDENPYRAKWEEYARLGRQQTIAVTAFFLLGPCLIGPVVAWLSRVEMRGHSGVAIIGSIVLLAPIAFFANRVYWWECPRCGKTFHHRWGYTAVFGKRCLHCGLPKWGRPESTEDDECEAVGWGRSKRGDA